MSRKANRQAREHGRRATQVNEVPITPPTRQQAQEAIRHLQRVLDNHDCPKTYGTVVAGVTIAAAWDFLAHTHTGANDEADRFLNDAVHLFAVAERVAMGITEKVSVPCPEANGTATGPNRKLLESFAAKIGEKLTNDCGEEPHLCIKVGYI